MMRGFHVHKRVVLSLMMWSIAAYAQSVPQKMSFVGNLSASGGPASGVHDFTFALFDASTAGSQVWQESHASLTVTDGLVFAELGAQTPLTPMVLTGAPLWLEITVDSTTMAPRLPIDSVPFAVRSAVAARAESLGAYAATDYQRRVTATCANGIASVNQDGTATCASSNVISVGAPSGSGLTASTSAGAVSVGLQSCGTGNVLKSNGSQWSCQSDNDTGVTQVSPGAGLTASITPATRTLNIAPNFGSAAGTITQGNDPRLLPGPSGAGRVLYDTGTGWAGSNTGTAGQVLFGGAAPSFMPTTNITSVGTLSSLNVTNTATIGNLRFSPARPVSVTIHSSAFTPKGSSVIFNSNWYSGNDRYTDTPAGTEPLVAPLLLPNAAHINSLSCRILDNDSTREVSVAIAEMQANTDLCGSTSSGVSSAYRQIVAPCDLTVDNASQVLALRFYASGRCSIDSFSVYGCALMACTVNYSVASLP
jgi:hypothetical protein